METSLDSNWPRDISIDTTLNLYAIYIVLALATPTKPTKIMSPLSKGSLIVFVNTSHYPFPFLCLNLPGFHPIVKVF